jgi:hypothetical protein
MIKIASFGCGVDSVAGLLLNSDYDEIIFADTGSELPETYAYLDYFEKKSGLKITKVKSHLGKIYDYYNNKRCFPLPTFRDCTGKFKIQPIRKYIREKYGKKETFEMNIFIDYSEFHRMHTSDVKYAKNVYPLVEQKITREKCIELIKSKGYELPIKSGCFFCPFNTKKKWIELKNNHPDLFQKTLDLEKNAMYTKEGKRKWNLKPLINMRGKESKTLFECACFNG